MSALQLILASLRFHWRTNLAVACGVAAGTAVLTGALLVGDSMRGSLRHLTLDRLGCIDEALVTAHFFRAALADELPGKAAPAILLRVSLASADPQSPASANRVELIGCDDRFWQLGSGGPRQLPHPREIVLNRPLADQLGARVGDTVLLRLPRPGPIPADSALGRKRETVRSQRLTVSQIITADGLGQFGLRPTQRPPQNAYVPLDWLQDRLEQPGRANAILAAEQDDRTNSRGLTAPGRLANKVQLTDYGLNVHHTPQGYWNITSDRMLLDPAAERAILKVLGNLRRVRETHHEATREVRFTHPTVQSALTYLANTLACNGREIPYSTVTAIELANRPPLGPFLSLQNKPVAPLGPNEIALNAWAADRLHAKPGDTVRLSYFEPESIDGEVRQRSVGLRVAAVVQLAGAADDRALTPAVKGITDESTMTDWDPPFPFDAKRIRPPDERYWEDYGPTPKAFVSLSTGRRLWGSRFGQTTSIRVDAVGSKSEISNPSPLRDFSRLLQQRLDPAAMGMVFQPIKRQSLEASAGTTPFGVLFLCFSFFLIAAAVMLVALLFRLGIERRASEIGTLLALGLSRRQVGRLLLGEGLAVAAAGSLVGVPAGVGYAAFLLLGLRTWWLAAVATPFLRLHLTAASLAIGGASGLAIALAAIWLSVRRMARMPPRRLLAGQTTLGPVCWVPCPRLPWACGISTRIGMATRARPWHPRWIELALIAVVLTPPLVLLSVRMSDEIRAGAFFASGALALVALLALVWIRFQAGATGPAVRAGGGNLARLALRNAARNPGRTTLTIGLVAAATFLIAALSAFHIDPTGQTPALHSGNGGFALVAESDQPIFQNLGTPQGRTELGFSAEDERLMAGSTVVSLRVRPGDDASCLNLYRPRQPRLLGVPPTLIDRDGFAWADKPRDAANPWRLLDQPSAAAVPVILEKNTANYALNLWGGLGETFEITDGRGQPLRLQVAALLADSLFQGDLMIGEAAFLKQFPDTSGYRLFLVKTPPQQAPAVQKTLDQDMADYGLAVETTGRRLAEFLVVQNTYLSTFQSLGGLGLLLGTFGLAAVQLRNVFERRGELALLRAAGFRRRRLAGLVLLEHAVLLATGLGIGLVAALLAVLPQVHTTSMPWTSLVGTLAAVVVVGLATGSLAVRAVLRAPLLLSLREERP